MRIFLTGYMGSGKTLTGQILAERLNLDFIDLDHLFESKYHMTIPHFFRKYGEDLFRVLEQRILADNAERDQMVMSTGGGTPCFYNNMQLMNDHGITIYLKVPIETLYNRLLRSNKKRPLLSTGGEDLKSQIIRQLAERESYYNQAKIIIEDADHDMDDLLEKIEQVR
jgi:shikimate kinase